MDDGGRLNELGVRYVGGNISATSGSESSGKFTYASSMRALLGLIVSVLVGFVTLL